MSDAVLAAMLSATAITVLYVLGMRLYTRRLQRNAAKAV